MGIFPWTRKQSLFSRLQKGNIAKYCASEVKWLKMTMKLFWSCQNTHSWYAGKGGTSTEALDRGDFGVSGSSDFTGSVITASCSDGDGSDFGGGSDFTSSVFGFAAETAVTVFVIWTALLRRGSLDILTTAGAAPESSAVSTPDVARAVIDDLRSSS